MTQAELIQAAMEQQGITSLRKLAERLDVSHTLVAHWARDERTIQLEDAIVLAELAGLPPIRSAAELRLATPHNKDLHRVLLRLAKSTALIVAGLTHSAHDANAHNVKCAQSHIYNFTYSDSLYIHAGLRARVRRMVLRADIEQTTKSVTLQEQRSTGRR